MTSTPSVAKNGLIWLWLGPLFMLAGGVIGFGLRSGTAAAGSEPIVGGAPLPVWREAPIDPVDAVRRRAVGMPSLAPIVEQVRAGVVGIYTIHSSDAALPPPPAEADGESTASYGVSHGTGFVLSGDGLVLTAHHLVARPNTIVVQIPDVGAREAELVGEDPNTDLAVVRITDPPDELFALPLGDSRTIRQGDWVMTLGNPLQFRQSVGVGVVSFVGRHLQQDGMPVTSDHLQFTAPVNPGSSGSPVFDMDSRVVGITTRAVIEGEGLSFAIPSKVVKQVLHSMLRNDGRVRRAFMGIRFQKPERLHHASVHGPEAGVGVRVTKVLPGQPAEAAGIRDGDILLSFDGHAIDSVLDLHDWITWSAPGSTVEFDVVRDGERLGPVEVLLGELDVPGRAPPLDQ